MNKWEKIKMRDIVKINCESYSTMLHWDKVNYLDTGNITENKINNLQHIDLKKEKLPSRAKRLVSTNNIIYSTVRPEQRHYGIIKEQPENFVVSTGFLVIDVNQKKADAEFIYFFLTQDSIIAHLQSLAQQNVSSYPSIRPSDIENLEVLLPPIEIQRKIADILSSIESKIKNNAEIYTLLELYAKTIYDYWFLQYDFPNEEGKPYKSSGGRMVWSEELKQEIPEGWSIKTLKDITICHDSERVPLSSKERATIKGNIPYYGATGIMDYVNKAIFNGDYVLVAEDGSIMDEKNHPILQRVSGKAWINNHTHVLEPIKGYSCRFLMMLLKDISVLAIKTGSIQMKITQENLNKVKLLEAPLPLRESLNNYLSLIDSKILEVEKENQELILLRDWLLPLLMNGQVGFRNQTGKAE